MGILCGGCRNSGGNVLLNWGVDKEPLNQRIRKKERKGDPLQLVKISWEEVKTLVDVSCSPNLPIVDIVVSECKVEIIQNLSIVTSTKQGKKGLRVASVKTPRSLIKSRDWPDSDYTSPPPGLFFSPPVIVSRSSILCSLCQRYC